MKPTKLAPPTLLLNSPMLFTAQLPMHPSMWFLELKFRIHFCISPLKTLTSPKHQASWCCSGAANVTFPGRFKYHKTCVNAASCCYASRRAMQCSSPSAYFVPLHHPHSPLRFVGFCVFSDLEVMPAMVLLPVSHQANGRSLLGS